MNGFTAMIDNLAKEIVSAMDREDEAPKWDRPYKNVAGLFARYEIPEEDERKIYYWLYVAMHQREFAQRLTVPRAIHGVEKLSDISNDLDAWVDRLAKAPYDIPQTAAMQQVIDELDTAVARLMECVEEMECWKF